MHTRKPAVAGQFYAGQHDACLSEIRQCLEERPLEENLPDDIVAGIVPHAGWMFSGAVAAMVFAAIKEVHEKVHTFVLFGAIHRYNGLLGAVYNRGSWQSPLGEVKIDEDLADEILKDNDTVEANLDAHKDEHSIEVQVPFVQHLFVGAKIVPILVQPTENAVDIGRRVGEIIASVRDKKIVCIGSTDLTHYGPRYGFCPKGVGADAIQWARDVNDMEFIQAALNMDTQKMLQTASRNFSACGSGAATATVAAARQLGKQQGILLAHTNSSEVMQQKFDQTSQESVGYAAIIY